MKSVLLFLSFLIACEAQAQSPAEKVLIATRDALLKHRSISYKAELHMKFSNMPDTFEFIDDVRLKRVEGDTLFGGRIRQTTDDGGFILYDGADILRKEANPDTCFRFSPATGCGYTMDGGMYTMARWREFLKPELMEEMLEPDHLKSLLPDTVISGERCWHVRSKRPDNAGSQDAVTHLFISQRDHTLLLEELRMLVQGDVQFHRRWLLSYTYDQVADEDFTIADLLPNAVVLAYATPVVDPPLVVGDPTPALIGNVFGSSLAIDTIGTHGHFTFVDFWFMSCGPCRTASPLVDSLYSVYKDKGARFVGVNAVDNAHDDLADLPDYFQKHPVHFPMLIADMALEKAYHVSGHPTFYIIDRNGTIAATYDGYGRGMEKEWGAKLDELLGTK